MTIRRGGSSASRAVWAARNAAATTVSSSRRKSAAFSRSVASFVHASVIASRERAQSGGAGWGRYEDPEVKAYKLNVERQNGRAAMLGITGCLIHELLGVDALYPTGGLGGAAPPTIF